MVLVAVLIAGCQGSTAVVVPPTTAPSITVAATTTTTTSTAPATTAYRASAPQKSQDQAGGQLIAAWKAGDRVAAATDAAPAAIDAVFAQPFPAGGVQARGCSNPVAGPSTCIYRILVNGTLLALTAEANSGGWFISGARFES